MKRDFISITILCIIFISVTLIISIAPSIATIRVIAEDIYMMIEKNITIVRVILGMIGCGAIITAYTDTRKNENNYADIYLGVPGFYMILLSIGLRFI